MPVASLISIQYTPGLSLETSSEARAPAWKTPEASSLPSASNVLKSYQYLWEYETSPNDRHKYRSARSGPLYSNQ